MKNIHIIPTDKPSFGKYLVINKKGKLCIWSTDTMGSQITLNPQNIYITSDEEIKFKIILTTDHHLIKDGVQAIDDEFLEWFVNNPSCDKVEVVDDTLTVREASKLPLGTRNHKYKIIIPKEEPKPESVFENAKSSLKKYLFDNKEKVAKDLEQMREWSNINKQETLEEDDYSKILKATMVPKEYFGTKQDPLEEAAKEYSERHLDVSGTLGKYLVKAVFQDGGKWEQEQDKNKYSEEDLKEAFKQSRQAKIFEKDMPPVHNEFEDWFEQFKKK